MTSVNFYDSVFPAHAGVFPEGAQSPTAEQCLPRARGGVSTKYPLSVTGRKSSPRTRGCFYEYLTSDESVIVFPAHAGVFPR